MTSVAAGVTPVEASALNAIDRDWIAATLAGLIAIPSIGGSDAEIDIQHHLASDLRAFGLDVDLWEIDLPETSAADGFPGVEVTRSAAWGLVGTSIGAAGGGAAASDDGEAPAIALQGHVDVVPAGERTTWAADPFTPTWRGTRVHGRGACDMKAGLVANLAVAKAVADSAVRLRRRLALHCVVGEEDGGLGAFATLRRGHTAQSCIISEPTAGGLVTANAGSLTFTIELTGRATHASTAHCGTSVLDLYVDVHRALAQLSRRRNEHVEPLLRDQPTPYALVVGRVRAGTWSSSVPDRLTAEGRYGLRIDEDPAAARAEFEACLSDLADRVPELRQHPPTLTWSGGQFRGGRLPDDHPLEHLVADAHADTHRGTRPRVHGVPYGSDLRLYARAGIPTAHYGPGDVTVAHSAAESVDLDEVVTATQTLLLAALRRCGTH